MPDRFIQVLSEREVCLWLCFQVMRRGVLEWMKMRWPFCKWWGGGSGGGLWWKMLPPEKPKPKLEFCFLLFIVLFHRGPDTFLDYINIFVYVDKKKSPNS